MAQRRARAPWYVGSRTTNPYETWEFDTVANCTTVGVPISTTTAYTGMTIAWGDGNVTTVASVSDYVHTYGTAGQYHITIAYDDWANVELSYSISSSASSPIAEARTGIAKVYAIPRVANTSFMALFYHYTALTEVAADTFANNPQATDFDVTFATSSSLTAIPEGLFDNNTNVTSFGDTFASCTGLTSIPEGLFVNNTQVTTFDTTFYNCSSLTNQTVYIGSTIVTSAAYFMSNAGSSNTVYVPSGSTTETTFNSTATVGCTVSTY